jgi:CRISPR-associated protein Csd2
MMSQSVENRYDFVLFFDVQDGNPNGDPDAGNLPRIDAETGKGLVTDVCLKRKVRNYVDIIRGTQDNYFIFVKEKAILNKMIREGYESLGIDLNDPPSDKQDRDKRKKKGEAQGSEIEKGRSYMCKKFYDIRTFGAVLSTGANAGQVRGPIQITFGRSVEPIVALEHAITVCAARMEEKTIEEQIGIQGRKYTVPYGLYRAHGFISPHLAAQVGFDKNDLNLFWDSLINMFDHDHSAARGLMSTRRLIIFEHETALGNKPANELFERVTWKCTTEGPAREFKDYEIQLDGTAIKEVKKIIPVPANS